MLRKFIPVVTALLLSLPHEAFAVCTTLVKGPIAISVRQCRVVNAAATFKGDTKYNFIRDLPPANRAQFLSTYAGSLVEGVVTQSQAIREGISDEKGALLNEKISAFVPASQSSCNQILGKQIEVDLNQTCCDGGGKSPCLLDTGYILTQVKAAGAQKTTNTKKPPEIQALYVKARQAAAARDFKTSAALFEQLRTKGALDVFGQYQLGVVYRELDRCTQALPLLEPLHQKFEKKDYWTDTEPTIRRATFLYARCLSVISRASEATLVLQGFLVEPSRFAKEIRESLSHRDFGYIKTTKSWLKYKAGAERALGAPPLEDDSGSEIKFD